LFRQVSRDRLERAFRSAHAALIAERHTDGHWNGELSTSALSTATAVSALSVVQQNSDPSNVYTDLVAAGLAWLAKHQNEDGGWGDTTESISNISTTMVGRAAMHVAGAAGQYAACMRRAEGFLQSRCGKTVVEQAEAIRARYGKDRTFAVPILMTCALGGVVPWNEVLPLPFELACFPQAWFRFLRLPVVSYALPALIALGQAIFHHRPPRNPLTRLVRKLALRRSLRVLESIQPTSGGFLEAVPLTSFVTLSLASIRLHEHAVARKGVQFLLNSVRPDGSWAIDSNLATWVTTLSINALAAADELKNLKLRAELYDWLAGQQYMEPHPYTGAQPGGFGWTPLPGSVPDADDTAGAILALGHLEQSDGFRLSPGQASWQGQRSACNWLLSLQNRDGGVPTFCRGWGTLPFDRSGTDLTAHGLRALKFSADGRDGTEHVYKKAVARGLAYLASQQRSNGSWLPLWFGNQHARHDDNPAYGTARVLAAYRDLDKMNAEPARRGVAWLLAAQNADGGWGGDAGIVSSIEETALAVDVLLDSGPEAAAAANNGLAWLVQQVEARRLNQPTPIGFYFAKLWYFEKLYPVIFTVAALGRALRKLSPHQDAAFCANQQR